MVIVVPCYNEEKRLQSEAFLNFIDLNEQYTICFVNDGSQDNTSVFLQTLCSRYPERLLLIDNKHNQGKAEAIRGAMTQLQGKYTYIGFCDADLATPLEEFYRLKSACTDQFPIVFGSRIKRLGAQIERNSLRHYV